jgi:hypothetical protein
MDSATVALQMAMSLVRSEADVNMEPLWTTSILYFISECPDRDDGDVEYLCATSANAE